MFLKPHTEKKNQNGLTTGFSSDCLNTYNSSEVDPGLQFYGTAVNKIYLYPNGILSVNANLQAINDQLPTDGDDDTFASIVVPYYKGRLESDTPEKVQPVIFFVCR